MSKNQPSEKVLDFHQYSRNFTKEQLLSEKERAVNYYTASEYRLFPVRGKVPAVKKWLSDTKFDPLIESSDFKTNYGVILKADDLVIDVDVKNFAKVKNGILVKAGSGEHFDGMWKRLKPEDIGLDEDGQKDDPLKRLMADCGLPKYPNTYIVKSGGGGYHLHFKVSPGHRFVHALEKYPGIDIRKVGSFLVGPGCQHPITKGAYYIRRGTPAQILSLPVELFDVLRKRSISTGIGLEGFDDSEGNQDRFKKVLRSTEPAIEGSFGGLVTHQVALKAHDYGLSSGVAVELMLEIFNPRCIPEWEPDELRSRIETAYRGAHDSKGNEHPRADFADIAEEEDEPVDAITQWENDNKGKWNFKNKELRESDLGNTLCYFLEEEIAPGEANPLYRLFRYNQLKEDIEFTRVPPWSLTRKIPIYTRAQESCLKVYLSQQKHYITNTTCINEAVDTLANQYGYHPVRDYLNSLKWDGVPRLREFLSQYAGCADTELNAQLGKMTLLAAVYRAYEPGCQMDNILILEGNQGNGKSSLVRILGGAFGRTVHIDVKNRQGTVQAMLGGWILESAEMAFFRKADNDAIKDIVTTPTDAVRLPYERRVQDYPRASIIIGTRNPTAEGYFSDSTGHRRYWPVKTGYINLDALKRDRDQLFAEAVECYKNREPYWITDPRVLKDAEYQQALRQKTSILQHRVLHLMDSLDEKPERIEIIWLVQRLDIKDFDINGTVTTELVVAMRAAGWDRIHGRQIIFEQIDPLAGL